MEATRSQSRAVKSMFRDGADVGSFGPIGCIQQVSAERLKGFMGAVREDQSCITPVATRADVRGVADVIREGVRRIRESETNTRLSLRILVNSRTTEMLSRGITGTGADIEAVMPANNGYNVVYVGYNDESRTISPQLRGEFEEKIEASRRFYMQVPQQIVAGTNGYNISIVDGTDRSFSHAQFNSITNLLHTFGYDRQGARDIISNEANIIGLVEDHGRIVGISVTERRIIPLSNGGEIHIAELTDSVFDQRLRGQGLYPVLLNEMFLHIYDRCPEIDVVFTESNISTDSLLNMAARQGREIAGILPYHFRMAEPSGESELKSVVVTYLTREAIRNMLDLINTIRQDEVVSCAVLQDAVRS